MNGLQDSGSGLQGTTANSVELGETSSKSPKARSPKPEAQEQGGRGGLDPTRYGDWEIGGRCVDF